MNNTIKYIPIQNLDFDLDNPRIPKSIRLNGDLVKILEWMLKKENITDLMLSIGEKGYFPAEPILVVPNQKKKGRFTVIEGNRRFSAVYLLLNPEKAPLLKSKVNSISLEANIKPEEIPCLEFRTRDEILDYLGYRHITGVEAWDALAKARYLKQISSQYDSLNFTEKCKTLANVIGSKSSYVRQLLVGLMVYDHIEEKDFFDISNLDDRTFEFGTFYTAISKKNIANFIGIDIEKNNPTEKIKIEQLGKITKWIFEENSEGNTRLGESRNLGQLDRILDPQFASALEMFDKGEVSLSQAAELTDEADIIVDKKIFQALENIKIAWKYIPSIIYPNEFDSEKLLEINKYLKAIRQAVSAKLDKDELEL